MSWRRARRMSLLQGRSYINTITDLLIQLRVFST